MVSASFNTGTSTETSGTEGSGGGTISPRGSTSSSGVTRFGAFMASHSSGFPASKDLGGVPGLEAWLGGR